jgi:hypothetical protein
MYKTLRAKTNFLCARVCSRRVKEINKRAP